MSKFYILMDLGSGLVQDEVIDVFLTKDEAIERKDEIARKTGNHGTYIIERGQTK